MGTNIGTSIQVNGNKPPNVAAVLIDPSTGEAMSTTSTFSTLIRDAFDNYVPEEIWHPSVAGGDIVVLDGNAAGASYIVISKDPLAENTVTTLTSVANMQLAIEASFGVHMSQRVLGQEFSLELVSTDNIPTTFTDLTISSVTQTTTTIAVTTSAPHGLAVGNAISTYGVSDSRLNYPALVVASVPSPTQFTATAGPGGTIQSIASAGPYTSGFVSLRARLGGSASGTSMIFENATATNASFYSRSNSGDALASGAVNGNQSVSIGSTASVQLVNTAYTYAFTPTTEYRVALMSDRLQWYDAAVDATAQATARYTRTQVVPDNTKNYVVRLRATSNRATTRPVGKIVSAQKAGTTTATITTDVAHNLTTGDQIVIYGIANQTDFANIATATVAATASGNQLTIVMGATTPSITSAGGFVARVQGGNVPSSFIPQVAISATLATAADGTQALTLTGSAAWTGLLIGDYVNVHGLRVAAGGADLLCDGAWKVRNVSTTTLELGALQGTVPPANFGATVCGGAIIKRTDLRISFVRLYEFDRLRVEALSRPAGEVAASMPVVVQGGSVNVGSAVLAAGSAQVGLVKLSDGTNTTAVKAASAAAAATDPSAVVTLSPNSVGAVNLAIPTLVADVASAALTATTTTAAFTPTFGSEYEVNIVLGAVTGTTPTLDVVVQESDDSGTNWYDVYHFERITAGNQVVRSPKLVLTGNRVRYVQTVGGTTPSFTRAVNRLQGNAQVDTVRRLFDRSTIVLTTLGSATPALAARGCKNAQLVINLGAATTPPVMKLQATENGADWYDLPGTVSGVASSTVQLTVNNINALAIRAAVGTAGVTVTAGYVAVKAF
ncbi:hypothetical protein GJ654_10500 [Rhodoblastus acidophilus]|uniref:Uncharacterized protein n=1 Tax=Rhodoblastus acidophilus TaxID=1074 RepID=A0A6N8DRI0_RHOAC|nr:hypothetical protein [Rhodoblastus acidophilus]MCW2275156.1 hypothetical protein [Rhodoblastus acidophilus]MTV31424.1 hypothetical protein [Rhodoblastus acidophilus]